MFWRTSVTALALLSTAACATDRSLSPTEYENVVTRTYPVEPVEALAKARQIFELNDRSDYTFSYTDEYRLRAERKWFVYLVFWYADGLDTWEVSALPVSGGTAMRADARRDDMTVPGVAAYELFYARMDYLLGIGDQWVTCDDQYDRIADGVTWGRIGNLCELTDEETPASLRASTN